MPDKPEKHLSRRNFVQGVSVGIAASLGAPVLSALNLPEVAGAPLPAFPQGSPQNASIDPEHIFIPRKVENPVTVVTEPVMGSNIPMQMTYVEMVDGVYAPIGIRKPAGDGPFPFVLFCHMNGGMGTQWIREWTQYGSGTLEQFLAAGYAVAWARYRAEVNNSYGTKLVESTRQGRQLFNRGPLEYDDTISIIKYVKTLPYVDPDRVGYAGVSHGGESLLKICTEYDGLRCGIANEPACGEYLGVRPNPPRPAGTPAPPPLPETYAELPEAKLRELVAATRARLDLSVTNSRIDPIKTPLLIQGRDRDHNQPTFRLAYEILKEAGKNVEWKSYDHEEHGFLFIRRNERGVYAPDPIQTQIVRDSIAFMNKHLKA
jgi:dipeptidyl aminopeptidase/acylaminoacyl peptidase